MAQTQKVKAAPTQKSSKGCAKLNRQRNSEQNKRYIAGDLANVHKVARAIRFVYNEINAEFNRSVLKRIAAKSAGALRDGCMLYTKRSGNHVNWKDFA